MGKATDPAEIAAAFERALLAQPALAAMPLPGPVWLVLRDGGRRVASGWHEPAPLDAILKALWCELDSPFDLIELFTVEASHPLEIAFTQRALSEERGILGLEARFGDLVERVSPTTMIARNWSFERARDHLLQSLQLHPSTFRAAGGTFALLSGLQRVVILDPETGVRVHPVFRGQRTVAPEEVDAGRAREVAAGMADWLRRHLHDSGRLTYSWHMSRGKEGAGDNSIRRFMATVALGRLAVWTGTESDIEAAARNLAYNLAETYREDADGIGHIALQGSAKLGAMALAALAALEIGGDDQFTAQRAGLTRGIDALCLPSGRFRTFLYPEERADDNQNFYSGEALLYWAHLHRRDPEAIPAERFYRHADHYKGHFREAPNPAFVPWHTLGRCVMLETEAVPNSDSVAFVFAMNDWLLPMQQWEAAPYPDLRGRFYDPERPQFGPPHASSTGVYLEGLVKAWRLARRIGDEGRAADYAIAIRRGIRSLSQLQIRTEDAETDLWYVTKRNQAFGGLRTTEWDNRIRVDNVQHGLMALLDIISVPGEIEALFDSPVLDTGVPAKGAEGRQNVDTTVAKSAARDGIAAIAYRRGLETVRGAVQRGVSAGLAAHSGGGSASSLIGDAGHREIRNLRSGRPVAEELPTKDVEAPITIGMMRASGQPGTVALALAHAAAVQKARFFFFGPRDVDIAARRISALFYEGGSWRRRQAGFPDVIDNDEASRGVVNVWRALANGVPFTTHQLGGKWEVMQRLCTAGLCGKVTIPMTVVASFDDTTQMRRAAVRPVYFTAQH